MFLVVKLYFSLNVKGESNTLIISVSKLTPYNYYLILILSKFVPI